MTVPACCPPSSRRCTRRPPVGRIIGVDTGSRDRSGAVLAELIGQDAVFGMDRTTGFGQAVGARCGTARPPGGSDDSGQQQVEWVWLLHDDCEPAPETLERLLRAASRDRSVVVLGPKVLDGPDRRMLRETGVSIDRAGRRVTGIDAGEIDQGQHDHNRAVLAVGSAGMLVSRDVWDSSAGSTRSCELFRDDVDFCWRVHAAGYRVQVVTDAVHLPPRADRAGRRRHPEGSCPRAAWTGATRCTCSPSTCRSCPCWRSWPGASPERCCVPPTSCSPSRASGPSTSSPRSAGLFGHPLAAVEGPSPPRRRARAGLLRRADLHPARAAPLRRLGESHREPDVAAGRRRPARHASADGEDEDEPVHRARSDPPPHHGQPWRPARRRAAADRARRRAQAAGRQPSRRRRARARLGRRVRAVE